MLQIIFIAALVSSVVSLSITAVLFKVLAAYHLKVVDSYMKDVVAHVYFALPDPRARDLRATKTHI